MSLIGLLTDTEKQVHLGRLHMRPIQWHLKNNWKVPESLAKVIPVPRLLHLHLKCWLEEHNVLQGQPLHPLKTCSADLYRCIKRRVGHSFKRTHCKGNLVPSRKQLHIDYLDFKTVFLALKEFQDLCWNNIVLIAADKTTVVAHINKEGGGMKSGPLCALLWRILTWFSQKQVTLKAPHIPGQLNVVADKLSKTEWSLLLEVFHSICNRWHQPQIDIFAMRFNNKLTQFVSPVPDLLAWAIDSLSLSWEDLDPYSFSLVTILGGSGPIYLPNSNHLGQSDGEVTGLPMQGIILIAPGWPNMPWCWDLVAMSSQTPLCLPNLLTQPFNNTPHRNLSNLNLHAWS